MKNPHEAGFTLVQMSVALIIIGLIVGGILAGQDMIKAAATSAQISQIQKYQTAVALFQTKYNGYLPGDIPNPYATQFGFQIRGTSPGQGDGNGIVQGDNVTEHDTSQEGETVLFWEDLSTAGLIDEGFNTATYHNNIALTISSTPGISNFLPRAKIGGQGNYVYAWSNSGVNYFGLSQWGTIGTDGGTHSTDGITVQQAYNIDKKIDDGLPQTGTVRAYYLDNWAGDFYSSYGGQGIPGTNTSAWSPSSASCFDNGGIGGNTQNYSVEYQQGNNISCGLSFQFQTQ